MRHQVTRGMLSNALRELEVRMGLPPDTLALDKAPGRGGWIIVRPPAWMPFGDNRREARDMLATLQFANHVLDVKFWRERERVLRDEG